MKLKFIKMKLSKIINDSNVFAKILTRNLENKFNTDGISRMIYPLALILMLLSSLLFIEYKHPYFFLQDDNRDYHLPYYIYNFESILKGEIAIYNFYQFLGTPLVSLGQPATFYPVMYLSVFLSYAAFGHYFAAIDILIILHLLIGAVGFYKFMRFFSIQRKAAIFAGLTGSLSSFIIYASDSWGVRFRSCCIFPLDAVLGI